MKALCHYSHLPTDHLIIQCRILQAFCFVHIDPWVRMIPWRRAWQATAVFLPRESLGQRSLVGYSPWLSQSRTWLKWLSMHMHIQNTSLSKRLTQSYMLFSLLTMELEHISVIYLTSPLLMMQEFEAVARFTTTHKAALIANCWLKEQEHFKW